MLANPSHETHILPENTSQRFEHDRILHVNTWLTVLTSAAVGVLVSSVITVLGQYLERKVRRRELLFTKSIECAVRRNEFAHQLGQPGPYYDEVVVAGVYYGWLKHLLDYGELSEEAKKTPAYSEMTTAMKRDSK